MSTIFVDPSFRAYAMASARINLPSASVLITSIVLPVIARTTSPGLVAFPEGRFSEHGTTPSTGIEGLICAIARIAPITVAPPVMSYFINSMLSPGLSEMPPESKVIPFPTNASSSPPSSVAFAGVYFKTISLAGSSDPCETLNREPMPSCSIRASSSTSILRPNSVATSRARSDMFVGVM